MSARNVYPLIKRIRWAGRIVCLIITLFGAIMLMGAAVGEYYSQGFIEISLEGSLLALIGIVALAGCILSWRNDLLPGVMLVITSAGLATHVSFFAGRNHIFVWSMLGLPYLIAGILLLYAWQLLKRYT